MRLSALALSFALGVSTAAAQGDGPYPFEATQGSSSIKPRPSAAPSASAGSRARNAVASPAPATSAEPRSAAPTAAAKPAGGHGYFVEFRSRYALSYGHTYAVHGQIGQKITPKDVVGLHPATESSIPWMIGHFIPVISETGASDGDAEEKYVSARYRILLTRAEYAKLTSFLEQLKARSRLWHAAMYNCNAFVGDIARYVGLDVPSRFLYPKEFITEMRTINKGHARVAASAPLYTNAEVR